MTEDLSCGLERLCMSVFVLQLRATIYKNVGGAVPAATRSIIKEDRRAERASHIHQLARRQ